ncbi:MAG: ABC transporter permease [Thermodesulfovibrionales bacterium]
MTFTGKASAAVLGLILLSSLLAPLFWPIDPDEIDLDSIRRPPSAAHPLGTDSKGRDVFARVLHGGKLSLAISFSSAALSIAIGLCVGLVSGYFGGRIDTACMAAADLVLSFPALLLAIGISVLFPPGVYTVLLALAAFGWASFARLIRGHVLTLREAPFIEAARALGCSRLRILLRHLLPQCGQLAITLAALRVGGYLLTESALSFLGLGAQPPTATWGSMISANRVFISSAPWTALAPSFMIGLTVLSLNLLGDDLRSAFGGAGENVRVG